MVKIGFVKVCGTTDQFHSEANLEKAEETLEHFFMLCWSEGV